jgi:hypothetical protein
MSGSRKLKSMSDRCSSSKRASSTSWVGMEKPKEQSAGSEEGMKSNGSCEKSARFEMSGVDPSEHECWGRELEGIFDIRTFCRRVCGRCVSRLWKCVWGAAGPQIILEHCCIITISGRPTPLCP